jgi:diguanylate cyclase (GGDEF)-like protein
MSMRDERADTLDEELAALDAEHGQGGRSIGWLGGPRARRRATADRAAATAARVRGSADRQQSTRDRTQAACDRRDAEADRTSAVLQIVISETDSLTRTRIRSAGLADLELEVDRACRTDGLLAVAYVDVVGLKALNDAHGHAAGDELLRRVTRAIRRHLRTYDLVVRLGGDEFLCVMSGTTVEDARERFHAVQSELGRMPDRTEIKVGFAALAPGDEAASLIRRADSDLPARHITVAQILSAVNELGTASAALTAWELCVTEADARAAWDEAIEAAFLRSVGYGDDGDPLFRLTPAGHERERRPTPYPQRRKRDE